MNLVFRILSITFMFTLCATAEVVIEDYFDDDNGNWYGFLSSAYAVENGKFKIVANFPVDPRLN